MGNPDFDFSSTINLPVKKIPVHIKVLRNELK